MHRRAEGRDDVSLVAGLGIVALGALLLADQLDSIDLGWGWLATAVAALVGLMLLVSGLRADRRRAGGPDHGRETVSR